MEGATLGVDNGIDGKYINDSPIALTSKINNEEYIIQARPKFDVKDIVPLNFKTNTEGVYTIAIANRDGVFAASQEVYLVDNKTGAEINLKSGSFSFNAAAGIDNSRFSLKFQRTLGLSEKELADDSIILYKNNEALLVKSNDGDMKNIKVYSADGKLVVDQKNVNSTSATISNLKFSNQVYIVKITKQDNAIITKKVIN
jgi:hypothetical protein